MIVDAVLLAIMFIMMIYIACVAWHGSFLTLTVGSVSILAMIYCNYSVYKECKDMLNHIENGQSGNFENLIARI